MPSFRAVERSQLEAPRLQSWGDPRSVAFGSVEVDGDWQI